MDSVLERIREVWAKLRPDPAKTSLGWWMVAIHVAIVLLVGGGISYSATHMLHDLADEQGKSEEIHSCPFHDALLTKPDFQLRRIGVDGPAIRRILTKNERATVQRWIRITDAAMHEKPRGFPGFRVSPAAFLIDVLSPYTPTPTASFVAKIALVLLGLLQAKFSVKWFPCFGVQLRVIRPTVVTRPAQRTLIALICSLLC